MSTQATAPKLTVGQKLWYVPYDTRWDVERFVEIKKVGRTWAEIDRGQRIDVKTLAVDGGFYTSPGQCYLSPEAMEQNQQARRYLKKIRAFAEAHAYRSGPLPIPHEDILQAAKLLKVEIA